MPNSFRFAVIGAGRIAHKFCDAARRAGVEVAAVASKSEARAADFARTENIPAAFGDYVSMLDTVRPDAVYIATTPNFHFENILLCLSKKIPVLCEKPMVCTWEQAEAVFAEAKKQNTFVMEGMWARFLPQIVQAKKWIEEGLIGHVELATSTVAFRADYDPENRLFNPNLAGGAVWDVGVYALELITFLMGEQPLEIQPMITRTPSGVDRAASINLRFSDALACAQTSCLACAPNGIAINGTEGYIWIPDALHRTEALRYNRAEALAEHFIADFENGFVFEVEEVVRCVQNGWLESPTIPWKDTVACAGIFDQILQTADASESV